MRYIIFFSFLVALLGLRPNLNAQANLDSIYQANLTKKEINGVYIPASMKEAFRELVNLSSEASLDKLKAAPEEVAATKLHLGLGKWIAANWNFYGGSRFTKHLNELGVSYPDDMIRFTIVSFHRFLNQRDLELEERGAVYDKKREEELNERLKNARTISTRKVKN